MFSSITGHAGALAAGVVVLAGAAILPGGAAAADPNQDNKFLALLDQEGIPAVENVPSLIATAHKVCRELDGGMSANAIVESMVGNATSIDPAERQYDAGRLARTQAHFIIASVGAYCPWNQGKVVPAHGHSAPVSNRSARGVTDMPLAWQRPTASGTIQLVQVIGTVVPEGLTPPGPPEIPAPPPPVQHLTPPQPIDLPPPPKQRPPKPQLPPPSPKQLPPQPPPPQAPPPPAVGPAPGGSAGTGGGGITGGGGGLGGGGNGPGGTGGGGKPAVPSPAPDMPPGFVRLAP
jgi:uncharacterized membrane protein YgcG